MPAKKIGDADAENPVISAGLSSVWQTAQPSLFPQHRYADAAVSRHDGPHKVGALVNRLTVLATLVEPKALVAEEALDPDDNFLIAICEAGSANCLVTGVAIGFEFNLLTDPSVHSVIYNTNGEKEGTSSADLKNLYWGPGVTYDAQTVTSWNSEQIKLSQHVTKISIAKDASLTLNDEGTLGGKDGYLVLQNGITGEGNLVVDTTDGDSKKTTKPLYLGGTNTFSGSTIITEGSVLYVDTPDALQKSNELILKAGSKFVVENQSGTPSLKSVTFHGSSDPTGTDTLLPDQQETRQC